VIPVAIGLALAAAVVHGTWNVLVKVSGDPLTTFQRGTVLAVLIGTLPVAIAWFAIGRPSISVAAIGFAVASAVFELAYLWLLSAAYGRGELSVVYPIARGSAPLLAVVIGIAVLGERLSALQLAGVVLLLGGILAVTVPQTSGRATFPALMTGVAIAAYTAIDRGSGRAGHCHPSGGRPSAHPARGRGRAGAVAAAGGAHRGVHVGRVLAGAARAVHSASFGGRAGAGGRCRGRGRVGRLEAARAAFGGA